MDTTHEFLANLGISINQARDFLLNNIGTPEVIIATAQQHGITNQMLADIYGGVSASDVINFFSAHGLDTSHLDGNSSDLNALITPDSELLSLVNELNPESIELETLRDNVINGYEKFGITTPGTGESLYLEAFSPSRFTGWEDGTWSESEHGMEGIGALSATTENAEVLFYQLVQAALKNFSWDEGTELTNYLVNHSIEWESTESRSDYTAFLDGIYTSETSNPRYDSNDILSLQAEAARAFVHHVESGLQMNLSDGPYALFLAY